MLGAERLGYCKVSSCLFLERVSFATKPLWVFSAAVVTLDSEELKLPGRQNLGGYKYTLLKLSRRSNLNNMRREDSEGPEQPRYVVGIAVASHRTCQEGPV